MRLDQSRLFFHVKVYPYESEKIEGEPRRTWRLTFDKETLELADWTPNYKRPPQKMITNALEFIATIETVKAEAHGRE